MTSTESVGGMYSWMINGWLWWIMVVVDG